MLITSFEFQLAQCSRHIFWIKKALQGFALIHFYGTCPLTRIIREWRLWDYIITIKNKQLYHRSIRGKMCSIRRIAISWRCRMTAVASYWNIEWFFHLKSEEIAEEYTDHEDGSTQAVFRRTHHENCPTWYADCEKEGYRNDAIVDFEKERLIDVY